MSRIRSKLLVVVLASVLVLACCKTNDYKDSIIMDIRNFGHYNFSLDAQKSLTFCCDGTYKSSRTPLIGVSFYQNGKLAIRILKVKTEAFDQDAYNVTYGTWDKSIVQSAKFSEVLINRTSVALAGRYHCAALVESTWHERNSSNSIDVRFGSVCHNNVGEQKGYGEDKDCNLNLEVQCLNTYPMPEFHCELRNRTSDKTLQVFEPELEVINNPSGLYNVSGKFHWQVKDLGITRAPGIIYDCYVISGVDSYMKRFQFPDADLGTFQCPEPGKIKDGSISISHRDCFGQPDSGSIASYECDEGFKMNGPSQLYCRETSWRHKYDRFTSNVTCEKDEGYENNNKNSVTLASILLMFSLIFTLCTFS